MSLLRLNIMRLGHGEAGKCGVCGSCDVHSHFDADLHRAGRGLVCDFCARHVKNAEIQLLAWLDGLEPLTRLAPMRRDGLFYNSRRRERG